MDSEQYTIAVPEPETQQATCEADQVDMSILQVYFPLVPQEPQMQGQANQPREENLNILLSTQDLFEIEQGINTEESTQDEPPIDNSKYEN